MTFLPQLSELSLGKPLLLLINSLTWWQAIIFRYKNRIGCGGQTIEIFFQGHWVKTSRLKRRLIVAKLRKMTAKIVLKHNLPILPKDKNIGLKGSTNSYLSKHFSMKLVTVVEQLVHPWQVSLLLDFSNFMTSLAILATEGLLCIPLAKYLCSVILLLLAINTTAVYECPL